MTEGKTPDGYITVHRVKGSHSKGNWVCRSRLQSAEEARIHRELLNSIFSESDTFETVSLPVYIDHDAVITEAGPRRSKGDGGMIETLPCPFCGRDAEHRRFVGNGFTLARVEYTQVRCKRCKIETEPMQPHGKEDRALAAWNRRKALEEAE